MRLGGSWLVGVISHVGAAVPACGFPHGGSERHNQLCSHSTEKGLFPEKAKPRLAHRRSVPAPTAPSWGVSLPAALMRKAYLDQPFLTSGSALNLCPHPLAIAHWTGSWHLPPDQPVREQAGDLWGGLVPKLCPERDNLRQLLELSPGASDPREGKVDASVYNDPPSGVTLYHFPVILLGYPDQLCSWERRHRTQVKRGESLGTILELVAIPLSPNAASPVFHLPEVYRLTGPLPVLGPMLTPHYESSSLLQPWPNSLNSTMCWAESGLSNIVFAWNGLFEGETPLKVHFITNTLWIFSHWRDVSCSQFPEPFLIGPSYLSRSSLPEHELRREWLPCSECQQCAGHAHKQLPLPSLWAFRLDMAILQRRKTEQRC